MAHIIVTVSIAKPRGIVLDDLTTVDIACVRKPVVLVVSLAHVLYGEFHVAIVSSVKLPLNKHFDDGSEVVVLVCLQRSSTRHCERARSRLRLLISLGFLPMPLCVWPRVNVTPDLLLPY